MAESKSVKIVRLRVVLFTRTSRRKKPNGMWHASGPPVKKEACSFVRVYRRTRRQWNTRRLIQRRRGRWGLPMWQWAESVSDTYHHVCGGWRSCWRSREWKAVVGWVHLGSNRTRTTTRRRRPKMRNTGWRWGLRSSDTCIYIDRHVKLYILRRMHNNIRLLRACGRAWSHHIAELALSRTNGVW